MNAFKNMFLCMLLLATLAYTQNIYAQGPALSSFGTVQGAEQGNSIVQTTDGGYVILASGSINPPFNNLFGTTLIKTDCNGAIEFYRTLKIGDVSVGLNLHQTKDKGYVFQLISNSTQTNHVCIVKTDSAFNQQWCKQFPFSGLQTDDMILDVNENIYFVTNAQNTQGQYPEIALVKISLSGTLVFYKKFSYEYGLTPVALELTGNDEIVILSKAKSITDPFLNLAISKHNAQGNFILAKLYNTVYDAEPEDMEIDNSGNFYIAGRTPFIATAYDAFLLKLDAAFNLKYSKFYDASTAQGEAFRFLKLHLGKLYLLGDIGTFDERDMAITRTNLNGNIDWSKRYNASPLFTNYLFSGCINNQNNMVATGDFRVGSGRDAVMLSTDSSGWAGCFTQNFQWNIRDSILSSSSIAYIETSPATFPIDTQVSQAQLQINQNILCSQLPPCIAFSASKKSECPDLCYQFTNNSVPQPNGFWYWSFENGEPSYALSYNPPLVCYKDTGKHIVKLKLTLLGKTSEIQYDVKVEQDCYLNIPNVFTPNDDSVNDEFFIKNLPAEFTLKIYNRWGTLVYSNSDRSKMWDGKSENGKLVSEGVYFYVLESPTFEKSITGSVTVIP
ncbi:MAG: gliding motility-associated C-terminal domain-containing protein [Bacteroidetes bacterium]|nr:gliding motility-associated C-terminal domain-containing protein [Bacteroidota bacterium]